MIRTPIFAASAAALLASTSLASATELLGRAVLPAATFAPGPTSGQFITTANGQATPFTDAQPVQGFSGVVPGALPGTFDFLLDNGFGAKGNSADSLLRVYSLRPDFKTGTVSPVEFNTGAATTFASSNYYLSLSDPNGKAGFATVATQANYPNGTNSIPVANAIKTGKLLTGSDFDVEGVVRAKDGTYYFGDEFGPYVLHTDKSGALLSTPVAVPNTRALGANPFVQSPDSQTPTAGSALPAKGVTNLGASRGLEGLTLSPDGTKIFTLLEGALTTDPMPARRLINVFDVATGQFTDQSFAIKLDAPGNSIGDFQAINDHEFLVIERDQNQGDPRNPAIANPAKLKRIYKFDVSKLDADGFAEKTLVADLLDIADPNGLGGDGTIAGIYNMPFVTIENVLAIDANTILVANDNNFPFSAGRAPGVSDNDEIVLLRLDTPLNLDPRLTVALAAPEPGAAALFASALLGLGALRRRR